MLNQFFFLWCFQQLPPVSEIIVESHALASKANLVINPVREVLVVTWQYSVSPSTRPLTPQGNNVKSHTFSLVWEPATWYCTSVLWSIDCCQNRVCTDQYQMTFSRAEVSTHRGYVFLWSYPSYEYSIPSARALPLALIKSIYYKSSVTRPKRKQCWLNGERMLIHLSILSSPSLAI